MRITAIVAVFVAGMMYGVAHSAPDVKVGVGVWIWQLERCEGGDVDAIVARAQAAHLEHVLIRVTSDGDRWAKFNTKAKVLELAAKLRAKGIRVFAWGYHYPFAKNKTRMSRQVALVEEVLADAHFDGYVYNVETEFANHALAARALMAPVKELRDKRYPHKLIGYSTYCRIERGRGAQMPVEMFNRYCDVAMPQAYWKTFNWKPRHAAVEMCRTWAAREAKWRGSGKPELVKPLIPTAQAYTESRQTQYVPPLELAHFLDSTDGYFGTNVWSWEHMGNEHWEVLETGAAKYLELNETAPKAVAKQSPKAPNVEEQPEVEASAPTQPIDEEEAAELIELIFQILATIWLTSVVYAIVAIWLAGAVAVWLTETGRYPGRPWYINLGAGAAWVWFAALAIIRFVLVVAVLASRLLAWLYTIFSPVVASAVRRVQIYLSSRRP